MRALVGMMLACACGPVSVESPDLLKGMRELGAKLDQSALPKLLADQTAKAEDRAKAAEASNAELAAQLEKARTGANAPYELELECEAAPGSQSEITTAIDGVHASSVGCPSHSGRIALRQWAPKENRLHVELHVGNDTAGYNSFAVRLWHGTENVWTVARGNPMTKTDGCRSAPDHRVECSFDDPFQVKVDAGDAPHPKVRSIDRSQQF